jgi:TetR/AcrR family transcriptional regulator, tetracycline repressor protein
MSEVTGKPGARKVSGSAAGGRVAGRAGLVREQLVEASLVLLRESGLEALSTRRLAARLGVQSPALYWHVRDKNELLALVADAICAQIAMPAFRLSPRRRLEAIAREYRRVLLAYPDAPRLFAELPPIGPHRMRLYDAAVGALRDTGFPAAQAVAMATFYRHFLLGMVAEEARQGRARGPLPAHALGQELAHLGDASRCYPNLREANPSLAAIESERLFEMGLETLLDGIEHRVGAFRRASAARRGESRKRP